MRDWRKALGVGLGLCLAAGLVVLGERLRGSGAARTAGPLLSECDGSIQELVIHYVKDAAPLVETAYRQFLSQLPAEAKVHVVCPDQAAFDGLVARVGPVACTLVPVLVGHEMTCWSRDRWLAFEPARRGGPVLLLTPGSEAGSELWPRRAGDAQVAGDLVRALGGKARTERSELHFDGGDFLADDRTVFVAPAVVARNVQRTVQSVEELLDVLGRRFQRRILFLEGAPDHHVAMFMVAVGGGTVLVGDPSLAERLLRDDGEAMGLACPTGGGDDFSSETQQRFDAVAAQCAQAGYRVVRIPVVPGRDGRTYVTYVNVVLDQRGGRRIVYLPTYAHAPRLNAAAAEVWRSLGYDVRPVDCTDVYPHFGTLGCLVSVLRRG